ncbi:MAG: long-chain fatty acid--CoA ligase [Flavobacteriales bacterium]|nr:MAG: long-chain fatty acid--CoA ligase [Flavobacteriales bacterium]
MEITRIFDFPYYQLENYNLEAALVTKYNGRWQKTSTQEYIDKANAMSRALVQLGVKQNDRIAVISSTNRTEWNIVDIGISQLGAQTIPVYPSISSEEYLYMMNHSESIYCFVSDEEVYKKVKAIQAKTNIKEVYSFDEISGCKNYVELLKLGADTDNQDEVEKMKSAVKSEDLATIIYTSGTTGKPKGVMLSHNNLVSNVIDSLPRLPELGKDVRVLSFLPLCHVFERILIYLYQYAGVTVHYAEALDKIGENLREVKPHLMSVVPRLLEKLYDKIYVKGDELSGIKKYLFYWAIKIGEQYEPYGKNGFWYEKKLAIARKLVFSKWKDALGGHLNTMVSGSAALNPKLIRIFCATGMYIMEGYGLTETSPVIAVNMLNNNLFKIGTVGQPIRNVKVKIADDGEILIKGPNVMMGYYKDPEKTAAVMTGDYFHTGDKGEIDAEGFLKITGRKKELFKTSGGKYVIPTLLENKFKESPFIEQIMVIGEGEKMPAAFIQPNFEFIREWAKRKQHKIGATKEELIKNEKVIARIQKEVDRYNKQFGKWEQIKRFEFTPVVWGIDNGHLTPTMKMKRENIMNFYKHLYQKIYG